MVSLGLMAALIGVPILLGILFRVSGVFMYTSLVVGQLLVLMVGDDAGVAASAFIKGSYSQVISSMLLLVTPLLVTVLLLKHTTSKSKLLLNVPAYIAVGISLYVFTIPVLPSGVIGATFTNPFGSTVNHAQDLVIAGSGLIVLATMWLTSRHHEAHAKHHKHK